MRVLIKSVLSPLRPEALNAAAPDEGNMYLLGRIATPSRGRRFLQPLHAGETHSAFFMTDPARAGGAGSDSSMLKNTAGRCSGGWAINGRKIFITGAMGASVGIIMARTGEGERPLATMFLVALPDPAIRIERILDAIDCWVPGGHAVVAVDNLHVGDEQVLGEIDVGFHNTQIRLSPARLSHCMRWLGAALRAQEITVRYAITREAFGKFLIDHEGVGFMLAENTIALRQANLMIEWCAEFSTAGL